ncbi:MAG: hypothetical protein LBQ39_07020 [Tannerellaceae bacterium]|nr:hypothetical protein [Tannerellaceae bacterium]
MIKRFFYPAISMASLYLNMTEKEGKAYDMMPTEDQIKFILNNLPEDERQFTNRQLISDHWDMVRHAEGVPNPGVCRVCGCTEYDPCYHPDYGSCWWNNEEETLCSHCADEAIANDPATERPPTVRRAVF